MLRWFSDHHRAIAATVLVLWAASFVGFIALVVVYDLDFFGVVGGPWVLGVSTFVITGALITWQRPDNAMGPLFLAFGFAITLGNTIAAVTLGPLADQPTTVRALIAAVGVAVGTVSFALVPIALVTFPDGRLPSARWRWVWPTAALTATLGAVAAFLVGGWNGEVEEVIVGPPFEGAPDAAGQALSPIYLILTMILLVAGAVALVLRYRRSDATVRRQIRWLVLAVLLNAVVLGAFVLTDVVLERPLLEETAPAILGLTIVSALAFIPISVAIAILRHRLFDIDVVISRSLVVGVLAGFIGLVYVGVVVGVGRVVGVGEDGSLGLKVVATAIVAVAFQPVRVRVRRWADRVVFGHRATPYEVLAGFSRQAASAADETSLQRIAEVLAAGTGAQPATVWLRVGEQVRAVASSGNGAGPSGAGLPVLSLVDGGLPELPVSLVVPVRHDGELLGAVSLTKPRSEPPTRQDEELAGRLARGLALVLRNARLTAELREHLAVLQASRSRLVRAQDEARRAIEGQLRAGAQQQLGELKARLGVVARGAGTAGAVRTAALLEQLEGEADDADGTLRALGQGIYPPLLEAEGLGAAVAAQAARSALPVTVHAAGLPRYPGEVEVAVYFSILEALQNAAKYARASSVHVRLEQRDDGLRFEVADDGIGFDPDHTSHGSGLAGIAARLDTIDATLKVDSRPGTGTRLTGHVPTPPAATPPSRPPTHPMEVPA